MGWNGGIGYRVMGTPPSRGSTAGWGVGDVYVNKLLWLPLTGAGGDVCMWGSAKLPLNELTFENINGRNRIANVGRRGVSDECGVHGNIVRLLSDKKNGNAVTIALS